MQTNAVFSRAYVSFIYLSLTEVIMYFVGNIFDGSTPTVTCRAFKYNCNVDEYLEKAENVSLGRNFKRVKYNGYSIFNVFI